MLKKLFVLGTLWFSTIAVAHAERIDDSARQAKSFDEIEHLIKYDDKSCIINVATDKGASSKVECSGHLLGFLRDGDVLIQFFPKNEKNGVLTYIMSVGKVETSAIPSTQPIPTMIHYNLSVQMAKDYIGPTHGECTQSQPEGMFKCESVTNNVKYSITAFGGKETKIK